jgi:hypothetical protein
MKLFLAASLFVLPCAAQFRQDPGKPIGKISTQGNLIVMELDEGVLGKSNMFDLAGRTLHFTPDGEGYRVENTALQWDSDFGPEASAQVALRNFAFPFSGKNWDAISVGATGSIAFGASGGRGGGVSIGRFDQLQEAARTLVNATPAICVFFKPRMYGARYAKELADRLVLTWDLTEPAGGIQDFTWVKTVNRFQAVLHKDGSIAMSYKDLAARDAIVGVYPSVNAGAERALAALDAKEGGSLRNVKLSAVDGVYLKVTFESRDAITPEGDPSVSNANYRIAFAPRRAGATAVWTIRGGGRGGRGGANRYFASGPGVLPGVTVKDNTISIRGTLPSALNSAGEVTVAASAGSAGQVDPRVVKLDGIRSPEVDLSALKAQDGPFPVVYESFHYLSLPNPRDMTCTVIKALGDKFDFLAYYSDFRVDNQEAGTPSTGPLGGGPAGGAVTGIGATQRGLDSYCSQGRFQWQFVQPVYANANQMHERPPEGHSNDNNHNIGFYTRQLGERSPDGRMTAYNYAMSQIGHEMGHRWSAFVGAKVNGEVIPLGPTHWARGLQAPVAFPYQRPSEASAMGGGVWQDNFDGTYTQLDDDYYVPATGWSYLDLYLMGMITASEVPDFFLLPNLMPAGRDPNGHAIFRADRVKVTIQDVIAAEGPRLPAVDEAQKKFNTGIVVMVEHSGKPSKELVERATGIREKWIDYWETTTGHRSSMTASPK